MLRKAKTARLVITLYRQVTDITNCRPTVGRLSADCRPTDSLCFGENLPAVCWPTDGRQSANRRLTVGRQSANRRPTVGRQVFWGALLHNYLLLYTYLTLFRKIDFSLVLEGKSSAYNIFTIIWNLSPALINSLYITVSWTLTDLQFKYSLI